MAVTAALRPASARELEALWPAASAALLAEEPRALEEQARRAPWSVLAGGKDEAALLEPWRDGSDMLAVRGLWCARRRVGELLAEIERIAAERGFARLLSPLVSEGESWPYERAGMRVVQRIVEMRLDRIGPVSSDTPPGVTVGESPGPDPAVLLAVDAEAFDDFWHYDAPLLERHLAHGRAAVAVRDGEVVGYTLCTVREGRGTLGRLAVLPRARRSGIGSALLADALAYMWRSGVASASLCTQEDNAGSRRLYERYGFRDLAGRLVFCMSLVRG